MLDLGLEAPVGEWLSLLAAASDDVSKRMQHGMLHAPLGGPNQSGRAGQYVIIDGGQIGYSTSIVAYSWGVRRNEEMKTGRLRQSGGFDLWLLLDRVGLLQFLDWGLARARS